MANATALMAFTATQALESIDQASANGYIITVELGVLVAKIIADEGTVATEAEALVGIGLAFGAPDAAATLSGAYVKNKTHGQMGVAVTPGTPALFEHSIGFVSTLLD